MDLGADVTEQYVVGETVRPPVRLRYRLPAKVRFFPIVFFETYLTFTVVLFAFGPWPWPVRDPQTLYGFLALAQLSLLLGFMHGAARATPASRGRWRIGSFVRFSIAINLAMVIPLMYVRGGGELNVWQAVADPGRAYNESRERVLGLSYAVNLFEYLNVVVSPVKWCILPLSLFYWRRLSRMARLGCFVAVIASILPSVVSGTNKALFDVVILFPWLVVGSRLAAPTTGTSLAPSTIGAGPNRRENACSDHGVAGPCACVLSVGQSRCARVARARLMPALTRTASFPLSRLLNPLCLQSD